MTEHNQETEKQQTHVHIENAHLHIQNAHLHIQNTYVPPERLPHDPAPLRAALVPIAAVPAAIVGFFLESIWATFAAYFLFVTLCDLLGHYLLKLKTSPKVDRDNLMLLRRVTPEQFDAYVATRRWIRCASLSVALVVGGVAFFVFPPLCLESMCGAYVLCTWIGIVYVRFLKIPRPKLVWPDNRCGVPVHAGYVDPGQYAATRIGWKISGPMGF
jgi:hypothetical protein